MHFYFPRSQIFLTAIHKNGCTSAMNYFGTIENFLNNSNIMLENLNVEHSANFDFSDNPVMVHLDKEIATRYMVNDVFSHEGAVNLSIAIIRTPFDRFASFWFNKIVLMQDTTYYQLARKYYPSTEIANFKTIREGAKNFLVSTDFRDLIENDEHLRHQYLSILLEKKYDLYVETKNLSGLPSMLSRKFPEYESLEASKFPNDNFTDKVQTRGFLDPELRAMIRDFYKKDFEFIDSLNLPSDMEVLYSASEPDENVLAFINKTRISGIFNGALRIHEIQDSRNSLMEQSIAEREELTQQRDELTQQRDELTQQRDELTQQRDELTQQRDNLIRERDAAAGALSAVVNSRIWRFTKLYRKLRSRKP
jgi:hypothetical protein